MVVITDIDSASEQAIIANIDSIDTRNMESVGTTEAVTQPDDG
jgi:hypothetical protein